MHWECRRKDMNLSGEKKTDLSLTLFLFFFDWSSANINRYVKIFAVHSS